jgi:hypothetical protein
LSTIVGNGRLFKARISPSSTIARRAMTPSLIRLRAPMPRAGTTRGSGIPAPDQALNFHRKRRRFIGCKSHEKMVNLFQENMGIPPRFEIILALTAKCGENKTLSKGL